MAWNTPMTAVENSLLTAAQFNVHLRDNLLETEAARATAPVGDTARVWGGDGPNRSSEHFVKDRNVDSPTETTSTDEGYTDLATPGPMCSMTTASGFLVMMNCQLWTNTVNDAFASYTIYESDINGVAPDSEAGFFESPANTSRSIHTDGAWPAGAAANASNRQGVVQLWGNVPVKGIYTVKMVYKVSSNDAIGSFAQRRLQVMAI